MNETREAAGAAMYQAVSRLAGFIASGRAEDSTLVHKKIHVVNFFVNKIQKYHAAAGGSGSSGLVPGWNRQHRVTPVNLREFRSARSNRMLNQTKHSRRLRRHDTFLSC
ncbi:MAG: hypothetical protein ACLFVO_25115 [Chloroflexaceae bacterium]